MRSVLSNWRKIAITLIDRGPERTNPAFHLWFGNGAAWIPNCLCADSSQITSSGISPAGSNACEAAQLAEKIPSLYTGKTSRADTLTKKHARRMGDHGGGEGVDG